MRIPLRKLLLLGLVGLAASACGRRATLPADTEIRLHGRQATLAIALTPVLCGSSFKNKGVQMLLDAVVDYLPSPLDVPPVEGINPHNGNETVRRPDDSEPFSAIAFKIMSDPYVGKLTYVRVYSGTFASDSRPTNARTPHEERVGQLKSPRGEKTETILAAVNRQVGSFRVADLQAECPGVGLDLIRRVLARLRKEKRIRAISTGRGARWERLGN